MNEFTGTKGPWMVYESQSHNESFDYAVVQDYGINGHIAYLTNFANVEPTEANAKLIAAAPELLEALQSAIRFVKHNHNERAFPSGIEKWQRVIIKALGND